MSRADFIAEVTKKYKEPRSLGEENDYLYTLMNKVTKLSILKATTERNDYKLR